ncbi:MAG: phosphodiester glycosidase family protein [Firmicutes bacterium]|nr:phosphodiester glycosidase family protein [Bacillota bacterium]
MSNRRNNSTKHAPRMKGWMIALMDLLLIGVCLVVFSLFHHVLPQEAVIPGESSLPTVNRPTPTPVVTTPTPGSDTTDPSVSPTPVVDQGQFGAKFADKFSDVLIHTDTEYRSKDIAITIESRTIEVDGHTVVYHLTDIYVRNIDNFKTKLANDKFGQGYSEDVRKMTFEAGGIVGMSGDMSSSRRGGIVIRNGVVYQEKPYRDVCVLYYDGTMVTYYQHDFDLEQAKANGAYQAWDFGPRLLGDNGEALETFNSTVNTYNPRAVVGYFEPGHYCFVAIDGRSMNGSYGMTMKQTSQLMHDLGCKAAFNLDGGQSAVLVHNNGDGDWENDWVNAPYKGGRNLSDILYIAETDLG